MITINYSVMDKYGSIEYGKFTCPSNVRKYTQALDMLIDYLNNEMSTSYTFLINSIDVKKEQI